MRRWRIVCRGAEEAGEDTMLFLNMWLLLGLLAVAVPVIIHLLNRQTARTVQWGAIQFLLDSIINRKRRIMLEEVLLLGARCLLLALVAIAVARPFVPPESQVPYAVVLPLILLAIVVSGVSFAMTQYPGMALALRISGAVLIVLAVLAIGLEKKFNLGRFGMSAAQSIAVVIDGSTSMTIGVDGKTNFERALAEAARLVETAGREADFSVILAGPFPVTVIGAPVSDRVKVLAAIEALKPVPGLSRIPEALSAATAALAHGSCPARKIVLITDGQRIGWEVDQPERWKFIGDMFAGMNPKPDFILRRLQAPAHFRNVGVAALDFSRDAVGIDREVGINVRVENTGTEAVTPSELRLKIGAETLTDRTPGQIEPGSSETVRFTHRFKKAGTHALVAQVVVKDDLPADDTFAAAVNVIGSLRVLMIDGSPSSRFLEGAASFAALAMAPGDDTVTGNSGSGSARSIEQGVDRFLIEPRIVDIMALRDVGRFEDYDVVVLADVPRLPVKLAGELATYVHNGGGLLVSPGENAQRDFYNTWCTESGNRVLPSEIGSRIVTKPGEEAKLALATLDHHAFRSIGENSRSDIGAAVFTAYWQLTEGSREKTVAMGARMNNGDAFLAERRLGRGMVLITACSLDNRGSNLAGRSSFVPLIHELVYYLSNPARPNLAVLPGPDIALRLTANRSGKPLDKEVMVDVAGPGSLKCKGRILDAGDGVILRMDGLQNPGLYRISVPDSLRDRCSDLFSADGTIPFAVAQEIEESRMQPLSVADMELVKRFTRLSRPDSADEARQILAGKTSGHELWRPLAIAAMLVLLIETGITRWIAARRRTGSGDNVVFEGRRNPVIPFAKQLEKIRNGN